MGWPRLLLLVLLAVAVVSAESRLTHAAKSPLKRCRVECKQAKKVCVRQVKSELHALLGDCTGSGAVRRQCRQQARRTARTGRSVCGTFTRDCRQCCGDGGEACATRCGDASVNAAQGEQCDPPGSTCGTGGVCNSECHCPPTSTTVPASAPSPPRIVSLVATNTDALRVAWLPSIDDTTPASALRYEVHVSEASPFEPTAATLRSTVTGLAPTDAPHGDVSALLAGSTVHVLVVALDDAGRRSAIDAADYRTLSLPTAPVVRSATTPLQTAADLGLGEPVVDVTTYSYFAAPNSTAPTVGAVLFGERQGTGYLRKVVAVSTPPGQIVVETSDASLSDAVEQMTVSSAQVLFASTPAVAVTAVSARAARGRAASSDVDVDSSVDFEPELRTFATWTTDLLDGVTLTSAEVVARGTLSLSLDAHYRFLAAGGVQRSIPFPLVTRTYTSVYVVGGVPVHQQITFTLDAEVSATASAAIDATARARATATVEMGLRYNPVTESWDDVATANFKPTLTADLVVKGKVVGEVRLVPRIEVKFYDVVSANLSIEPSLRAEIATQATVTPPCAPFELSTFDANLVVEPYVSADFRALARNVSLVGRTRVGGPFTFKLFDLPSAQVSSQAQGNGQVSVLATVTDGTNDPFDPASARWDVTPAGGSVTPATGNTLGALTCTQAATYKVVFSGTGALGEQARRCTAIDVPCQPTTTTTTLTPSSTTSTTTLPGSTTTTTPTTTSSTTTTNPGGGPCGTFLTTWGVSGTGPGQFIGPRGVAVDRRSTSGSVYVTDGGTNRVQKFDRNGGFITQWGSGGTGDGGFNGILGVAVNASGVVYVVDADGDRIQKFDENGVFLGKWGTEGTGDGQFDLPYTIAIDGTGNVYVVDIRNSRIQKFDANGVFLAKWGQPGMLDGDFSSPHGIAIDGLGNVFVLEQGGVRVQKFSSSGTFISKWGVRGGEDGQLKSPIAIATDASGNVFVSDPSRGDVQRFNGSGTFMSKWGSTGIGNGQFTWAISVASDGDGHIYVADRDQRRVQKFACR